MHTNKAIYSFLDGHVAYGADSTGATPTIGQALFATGGVTGVTGATPGNASTSYGDTWVFGYTFTALKSVTVYSLGWYYLGLGGAGCSNQTMLSIALLNSNTVSTTLETVPVSLTSTVSSDGFIYATLATPFTVTAGSTYAIGFAPGAGSGASNHLPCTWGNGTLSFDSTLITATSGVPAGGGCFYSNSSSSSPGVLYSGESLSPGGNSPAVGFKYH